MLDNSVRDIENRTENIENGTENTVRDVENGTENAESSKLGDIVDKCEKEFPPNQYIENLDAPELTRT